jgi:glutamate N-acetyltransferase/amino-acid N-acetyltransferase
MQNDIKFIDGGVCAPLGFTANGMLCHIKASRTKNDTALVIQKYHVPRPECLQKTA